MKSRDLYLLELLYRNDGDDMTGLELVKASDTMLTRFGIYRQLDWLRERGLVQRGANTLTAAGCDAVRRERDMIPLRLTELDHQSRNLWAIVIGMWLCLLVTIATMGG